MAVDFPSDLIEGVMAAALPVDAPEVAAKLSANKAATTTSFAKHISALDDLAPRTAVEMQQLSAPEKFEALVVSQMLDGMLAESGAYFGDGFAGDMWKSMMSEHMAKAIVGRADFGIASLIEGDFVRHGEEIVPVSGTRDTDDVVGQSRGADQTRAALDEITRDFLNVRNQPGRAV